MANYHEYAVREVTDADHVGTGTGTDADGKERVVVSLDGKPINPELGQEWQKINWTSLTPACAKRLYELLGSMRHIWESTD